MLSVFPSCDGKGMKTDADGRVEQADGDSVKHFTARPLQYPAKHVPNIPDEFTWNDASPFLGLVWFHLWPTSTRVIKLSSTSYGINTLIDSHTHTVCVFFQRIPSEFPPQSGLSLAVPPRSCPAIRRSAGRTAIHWLSIKQPKERAVI